MRLIDREPRAIFFVLLKPSLEASDDKSLLRLKVEGYRRPHTSVYFKQQD
jgi:hypothetical protein